ncbi:hypothetical protein PAESOLCIP111_01560 [Paenibacillus solanacearum]|uniref:Uncharacterized protein n=1 Tax=Paenibacillus solanacearum TaxID=2048548 RepID=A0A916NPA0_9BACL|nr:hypothetical protein PAESOLCIP111_01560 [Paenibacillus solanacearum]
MKRTYDKPVVLGHYHITFETLLSCSPPDHPGQDLVTGAPVCLRPDGSYYPR